jgi:hypothetical protein
MNKKKKNILIKKMNIEKERTGSLIQRERNTTNNNIHNYNNFTNSSIKSKNYFHINNNKSVINHNNKRHKKESSKESRNIPKGLHKHFNQSFNEYLFDNKLLNTLNNIDKNNISKNNLEINNSNHSNVIKIERNKRSSQDNSFIFSNDYEAIKKYMNINAIKSNQRDYNKSYLVRNDPYGNINKDYFKTINNNNSDNFKARLFKNNVKNSTKKHNHKKNEKVNNSII